MKVQYLISKLSTLFLILTLVAMSACGGGNSQEQTPNPTSQTKSSSLVTLDVYKSESCGCCGSWVEHMEDNNFNAQIHHPDDLNSIKQKYGIDPQWQSCHTAVSEQGFVFEGHIPAKFVQQFLENPPADAFGLAVAGMPLGSPGMEVGDRFTPYEVRLLKKDGSTEVYVAVNSLSEQF